MKPTTSSVVARSVMSVMKPSLQNILTLSMIRCQYFPDGTLSNKLTGLGAMSVATKKSGEIKCERRSGKDC